MNSNFVISSSRGGDCGVGGGGRCANAGRQTAKPSNSGSTLCCFCLSYMRDRRLFGSLRRLISRSRVSAEQRQQLGHLEEVEDDECQVEGAEEEDELRIIVDVDLTALARIRLHKPITMAGGIQKRNMHETEFFTEYGESSQYEIIEVVGKGAMELLGLRLKATLERKLQFRRSMMSLNMFPVQLDFLEKSSFSDCFGILIL